MRAKVHGSLIFLSVFLWISVQVFEPCREKEGRGEAPIFSFGVVADVQYCDSNPAGSRYYRSSLAKLEECAQKFNSSNLAFVVQLGDFIDRDFASFDKVLPIFQKLKCPKYPVLGNHEFSVGPEKREAVLEKLAMEKGYYDFAVQNWRFVVLDGNDISLYANPEGSRSYRDAAARIQELKESGAPNAQEWNGGLGAGQMAWLKDTLDKGLRAGERIILFCHFPVFPPNAHNLLNDGEVVELLESSHCVTAFLSGHNHHGSYGRRKGIHFLSLCGMVETPDQNAFAVVEVHPDRLEVTGFGREPSRTLHFDSKGVRSHDGRVPRCTLCPIQ